MLFGGLITTATVAPQARADEWTKKTVLTVKEPTQIDEVVLQPGVYVLRLLEQQTDRHVVQIFNREETHMIDTVVAIPTERLVPGSKSTFTFYETPAGSVHAMRAWYYPGDSYGQRFGYPKHLRASADGAVTTQATASTEPAPAAEPQPVQQAETQSQPATPPAEAAQNTPPVETPAPSPAPAETTVAQNTAPVETPAPVQSTPNLPAELPQTGSSYPVLGLLGILLIGSAIVLRRTAKRVTE